MESKQVGNYNSVCLVPRQNVIAMTTLRHEYDVMVVTATIYDVIDIEAWQIVYVMLRQIFCDITN